MGESRNFHAGKAEPWRIVALLLLAFAAAALPGLLFAGEAAPARICTHNPGFAPVYAAPGMGIVSGVIASIRLILDGLAQNLYNSVILNPSFRVAATSALTLYVIIYGILFTFGMTQVTLMDFLVRCVKIGIVGALITPGSWTFFYNYVGVFFIEGTDELLELMASIATGTPLDPGGHAYPFAVIDNAIADLASPRMMAIMIATLLTGPYGLVLILIMLMGVGRFIGAILQAAWVYLMSLVVKIFLFALAPIFFIFLLFGRTRNLFDGWLNQLISASLQPIFLFAFFAFFAVLVRASLLKLMAVPACLTPIPGGSIPGTKITGEIWRFMRVDPATGQYVLNTGPVTFSDPTAFGIMDLLAFVLCVYLLVRFMSVSLQLAKDIAGGGFNLNVSGAVSEWLASSMPSATGGIKQVGGATQELVKAMRGGAAKPGAPGAGQPAQRPAPRRPPVP